MTNQQQADSLLEQWQQLRALAPDERIEALMASYFMAPPDDEILYEATLRRISEEMSHA